MATGTTSTGDDPNWGDFGVSAVDFLANIRASKSATFYSKDQLELLQRNGSLDAQEDFAENLVANCTDIRIRAPATDCNCPSIRAMTPQEQESYNFESNLDRQFADKDMTIPGNALACEYIRARHYGDITAQNAIAFDVIVNYLIFPFVGGPGPLRPRNAEFTPRNQSYPTAPPRSFRRLEARSLQTTGKVNQLTNQMKCAGWVGEPIAVFEYKGVMYILDGHHRVEAAARAGIPVPYAIIPETELSTYGYSSVNSLLQSASEAYGL